MAGEAGGTIRTMAARRILQLGDPLLRVVSRPCPDLAYAERVLADLRDTLHEFQRAHSFGRGISAVQIGEPVRIIYVECERRPYHLVDPAWEWQSAETFEVWDDCFSFPNLMVRVRRAVAVRLRYREADGTPGAVEATGALSELLQHEMDHLDGVLAIDRAEGQDALATREEWERRYRQPLQ